jgi:hypothetical protein
MSLGKGYLGRYRFLGNVDEETWDGEPAQLIVLAFPDADIAAISGHPDTAFIDIDEPSLGPKSLTEIVQKLRPAAPELIAQVG